MKRLVLAALVLVFTLQSWPVLAEDMSSAPMVRSRLNWLEGRSELKPSLGWTLNDAYYHNFIINMGYAYHVFSWLGVGANVGWAFPIKTSLAESIEEQKKQEGPSFPIPATHLGLMGDVFLEASFGGKFMLLGKLARAYDFHVLAGVGVTQVRWNSEAAGRLKFEEPNNGFKMAGTFGAGVRIFLDKGVALTFDIIDHMSYMHSIALVSEDLKAYTLPVEEKLTSNIAAMLSFSIMMPYDTVHED